MLWSAYNRFCQTFLYDNTEKLLAHGFLFYFFNWKKIQKELASQVVYFYFYFFNFSNLLDRWVGDHPQEDLAKFGYMSKMRVEKFSNHAIACSHGDMLQPKIWQL